MNDFAQWGILVLLLLIIGPLIFWIVSLLITWIKWLTEGKKELNQSFAIMNDFNNPVSKTVNVNIELGSKSNNLLVKLLDESFTEIKTLKQNNNVFNKFSFDIDTTKINNGSYFCQLITDNQKTVKKLIIKN